MSDEEPVYPSDEWQEALMRQTEAKLWKWKAAYYGGSPLVQDTEFDLWWRNLLFLESKYPHLASPDSPTQSVGYQEGTKLPKPE